MVWAGGAGGAARGGAKEGVATGKEGTTPQQEQECHERDEDYESITLMRLKQAQERKREREPNT